MEILGIDIGDSGIRGCITDTKSGDCLSELENTSPLEDTAPHKVLAKTHELVCKQFDWTGPVGCAFPAPVQNGFILSGGNVDPSWIDANAEQLLSEITDNRFFVINNTDAAGLTEMRFGAGRGESGLTVMINLDLSIGSSLFMNGRLVPNIELGRMAINGQKINSWLSEVPSKDLSKELKAKHIQSVLEHLEEVFHPNLFILGGILSQKAEKTFPYIKISTPFKAAAYQDHASITGAALHAKMCLD